MSSSRAAFAPRAANSVKTLALTVALLAGVVGFCDVARAQSKCSAIKMKEVGKKLSGKAKVHAKALKKNEPPDAAKLAKYEMKFDAKCATAETQVDCWPNAAPCADLEQVVDQCIDGILADINNDGATASKCDSGKAKEAGKKFLCKAKVYSTSFKTNKSLDEAKLTKCDTKFIDKCEKADSQGDCTPGQSSCAVFADLPDQCLFPILLGIGTPPTTTSTSTTSTTTSTTLGPDSVVCCEDPPSCGFPICTCGSSTVSDCEMRGATPVGGGAVCDATGNCVPPPGTPGCCCGFPGGCFMLEGSVSELNCVAACDFFGNSWAFASVCTPQVGCVAQ